MRILLFGVIMVLVGCGEPIVSVEEPVDPLPVESIASMTEEERMVEIQKILTKINVTLPENWLEMEKDERGKFLLPYLMQANFE